MSKKYQAKPASLLGLEHDTLTAYCLNRAILLLGTAFDADLEEAQSKSKNKKNAAAKAAWTVEKWRGWDKAQFRDPASK